ncbi:hypothetical protein AWC29_08525 [Mycobacterium triplex]|uniref:Uncharacterized protein n=1 Tax=Mycobacterium triplex TaxID=47839 RepID=A0ABX3W9I4_9MYCO|nr:hypothetical protein AWC29_08525 [Mycobacterium triplex]
MTGPRRTPGADQHPEQVQRCHLVGDDDVTVCSRGSTPARDAGENDCAAIESLWDRKDDAERHRARLGGQLELQSPAVGSGIAGGSIDPIRGSAALRAPAHDARVI